MQNIHSTSVYGIRQVNMLVKVYNEGFIWRIMVTRLFHNDDTLVVISQS